MQPMQHSRGRLRYSVLITAMTLIGSCTADGVAPIVEFLSPLQNEEIVSGDLSVTIDANLFDSGSGVEVSAVRVLVDAQDRTSEFAVDAIRVSATLTQLPGDHSVEIRAVDRAGNQATGTVSYTVLGSLGAGIINSGGGRVEVTAADSRFLGAFVDVPADAVSSPTVFVIDAASPTGEPLPAAGVSAIFNLDSSAPFVGAVTVGIPYSADSVEFVGGIESKVVVFHRPTGQAQWQSVDSLVDTAANFVTAELSTFSPIQAAIQALDNEILLDRIAGSYTGPPTGETTGQAGRVAIEIPLGEFNALTLEEEGSLIFVERRSSQLDYRRIDAVQGRLPRGIGSLETFLERSEGAPGSVSIAVADIDVDPKSKLLVESENGASSIGGENSRSCLVREMDNESPDFSSPIRVLEIPNCEEITGTVVAAGSLGFIGIVDEVGQPSVVAINLSERDIKLSGATLHPEEFTTVVTSASVLSSASFLALDPESIHIEFNNLLYFVDATSSDARVRVVNFGPQDVFRFGRTLGAGQTTTLAGGGSLTANDMEIADQVSLSSITGLAIGIRGPTPASGTGLYFSDGVRSTVRGVTEFSGELTTIAGAGTSSLPLNGSRALEADLGAPGKLHVTRLNDVLIIDDAVNVLHQVGIPDQSCAGLARHALLGPGVESVTSCRTTLSVPGLVRPQRVLLRSLESASPKSVAFTQLTLDEGGQITIEGTVTPGASVVMLFPATESPVDAPGGEFTVTVPFSFGETHKATALDTLTGEFVELEVFVGAAAVAVHGNLTPELTATAPNGTQTVMEQGAEFDSTALTGPLSQVLCGNGLNDPEIFFAGGQQVMHAPMSQLGVRSSMNRWCRPGIVCPGQALPIPQMQCPSGTAVDGYIQATDSTIEALPTGRVVNTQLATRRTCVAGVPTRGTINSILVRHTDDCGASWQVTAVDADAVTGAGNAQPLGLTGYDRQELYVDDESDSLYLTVRTIKQGSNGGQILLRSSIGNLGGGGPSFGTIKVLPFSFVTKMSAIPGDGSNRLYLFYCQQVSPRPTLRFFDDPTQPGAELVQFPSGALGNLPDCDVVPSGTPGAGTPNAPGNVINRAAKGFHLDLVPFAPSDTFVVNTPSGPVNNRNDHIRIVYTDTINDFQIARLFDVIVTTQGDSSTGVNVVEVSAEQIRVLDESSSNAHVMWPDLVEVVDFHRTSTTVEDGFAHLLYFTSLTGKAPISTTQRPKVDVWRPVSGFTGVFNLDPSPATFAPQNDTPCRFGQPPQPPPPMPPVPPAAPCFFGDYKYATFVDDTEEIVDGVPTTTVRFFVPWSRPDSTVALSSRSIYTFGATVTQRLD